MDGWSDGWMDVQTDGQTGWQTDWQTKISIQRLGNYVPPGKVKTVVLYSNVGIGVWRGGTAKDKWLHVDTLILIPTFKIYIFSYSIQTEG
jgi:hypothetical protein